MIKSKCIGGEMTSLKTNSRIVKRSIALFFISQMFCCQFLGAQTSYQGWLEYKPSYALPRNYKLGMRASFRTNFEQPRWRTFEIRFMPEKKLGKHFDILASIQFLETLQFEEFSTSEIRLALGGRFHLLPGRRVESGVMARVEFRNVYEKETQEWTYTTRPRLRIFGSVPLNKKRISEDHALYVTSFVEFFYQNEDDVQERFSNRFWLRLGLGYKLNHNISFELLYSRQDSRNTFTTDIDEFTKQNIFVFTLKHKLNKPKK